MVAPGSQELSQVAHLPDEEMDLDRPEIIVPAPFRDNFFEIEDLNTDNTDRTLKYCEDLVQLYEETGDATWLKKRRLTLQASLLRHEVLGVHQQQCINALQAALDFPVHQERSLLRQQTPLENRIEFSINQRGDISFTLKHTCPSRSPEPKLYTERQVFGGYWQLGSLEERFERAGIDAPVILATHWNVVAIRTAYSYLKDYKDNLVNQLAIVELGITLGSNRLVPCLGRILFRDINLEGYEETRNALSGAVVYKDDIRDRDLIFWVEEKTYRDFWETGGLEDGITA
ncbi:hypothetical protein F5Y04DRAFT_276509 [Hypomontagnella monticulosa]|nr:hypothetical protein F5Y04DRAFT_276509 [Hypomontagnella monticulosa]